MIPRGRHLCGVMALSLALGLGCAHGAEPVDPATLERANLTRQRELLQRQMDELVRQMRDDKTEAPARDALAGRIVKLSEALSQSKAKEERLTKIGQAEKAREEDAAARKRDIEKRLDLPVSFQYQQVPASEAAIILGKQIGVDISVDPAVGARQVSVRVLDVPARDALVQFTASIDAHYEIRNGVVLIEPDAAQPAGAPVTPQAAQTAPADAQIRLRWPSGAELELQGQLPHSQVELALALAEEWSQPVKAGVLTYTLRSVPLDPPALARVLEKVAPMVRVEAFDTGGILVISGGDEAQMARAAAVIRALKNADSEGRPRAWRRPPAPPPPPPPQANGPRPPNPEGQF